MTITIINNSLEIVTESDGSLDIDNDKCSNRGVDGTSNETQFNAKQITNIYKDVIMQQQEKIQELKDEVTFLRNDSLRKTAAINSLIELTTCNLLRNVNSGDKNSTPKHNSFGEKWSIPESNFDPGNSENIRNLEKPLYVCTDEWTNECMTEDADHKKDDEEIEKNGGEDTQSADTTESELYSQLQIQTNSPLSNQNLYSDITEDSQNSLFQPKPKVHETLDYQLAKYRYEHRRVRLERKNEANNAIWASLKEKEGKIKASLEEIQKKSKAVNTHKWPKNTILIASDSMFNQLDEKRLSRNGLNTKVRAFSGSSVADMYFYLEPLLRKEPDYLILGVGTNDCGQNIPGEKVFNDILHLKEHIEERVPGIRVILSQPIVRFDNDIAQMRVKELVHKLKLSCRPFLANDNFNRKHIGKKGLHLNSYGTARIAMNIISLIKGL